ncbi:MAG: hypothetical protein M3P96_10125, partial [Actinomycetota bacterium]|nr:hypothetical protein [Actinomycetota bacterium]
MTEPGPGHDPIAALLRRALQTEAEMVQLPGDGLQKIQQRTAGSRPWWRPVTATVLGAAAVVTVATGAGIALTRSEEPTAAAVAIPQRAAASAGAGAPI